MGITKIFLTNQSDNKPRRELQVDEFSYTISTSSGEAIVTLPGGRSYNTDDYLVVDANGLKIYSGVDYTRSSSTTITAVTGEMFPEGKFPQNCVLNFEKVSTNN